MNALESVKEVVKRAWQNALRIQDIEYDDHFFNLGGHSLIAAKIVAVLAKNHQIRITVADIFNFPTINELMRKIERGMIKENPLLLQKQDRSIDRPLSLAQKRLWFLYKFRPDLPLYNIAMSMKIVGELDIKALKRALNALIKRQEGLRTIVKEIEGEAYQNILSEETSFPIREETIPIFQEKEVLAKIKREMSLPFDLGKDILCRCVLLHFSDREKIICFLFHHLIFDDWSMEVFSRELNYFYLKEKQKSKAELDPLQLQYVDFSVFQDDFLNSSALDIHFKYWQQKLAHADQISFPTDFPRPKLLEYRGHLLQRSISKELSISLKRFSAHHNVSLFILLLTCFKWVLSLFGKEDIVVGSPISHRPFVDQKNAIGYFINTLVFRTFISDQASFLDTLAAVKTTVLEGYEAQDVPFEKVVSLLNMKRALNKNPLFQIMFSIAYESDMESVKLDGLEMTNLNVFSGFSKFDLSLHALIRESTIEFHFEYLTELFKMESIAAFADAFLYVLQQVLDCPNITLSQIRPNVVTTRILNNHFICFEEKAEGGESFENDTNLDIENEILKIWKELLKQEEYSVFDNFFDVGGNSFLVIQMCDLIKRRLNFSVSVVDVFQYPTIRGLARFYVSFAPKSNYRKDSQIRGKHYKHSLQRFSSQS